MAIIEAMTLINVMILDQDNNGNNTVYVCLAMCWMGSKIWL